ncbi:1-phosphofructokinase family hexose kinase [Roseinatronobacter sp. HJB301]|uniref:Phosphofructokinase n=2 Tax=Roseinatronobacter alkalisoli TaxID=3028235 RepID=A0ABT5T9X6_9RHOB|nr:1-phosphofructokinase family hexose kinase [Roseinatronobacter sp. HJB301]MDD7971781.1 1-phosphofructokinase family hexose kinase [Roseinatronobacter sp. HJB301]
MAQTPILTVTLNPALDLSARVPEMVAGPKLRMTDPVYEPGGGGVNVARAINALDGQVRAWVALGGSTGAQHYALLHAQGVDVHQFDAPGDTRQSWAITDGQGQQFRLQLPGADWTQTDADRALADIVAQAAGLVVLSGSQPPGMDGAFPQQLARALHAGRLVLDTSGAALAQVVGQPDPAAPLHVLRLDQAEAEEQAAHPLPQVADVLEFAQKLVARGVAAHVCIAHGANGSVLAGRDLALHCRPPQVQVASKVGAGDSFTGAFTLSLARGQDMAQALLTGTAAAAAAVMTDGTALCRRADMQAILPECTLQTLRA